MAVWIIGSIFLLAAIWITQRLEMTVGVSTTSYMLALAIAFLLVLLGGLCWISVAVATRRKLL